METLDCSQSPIFSWDRRDIARLTVNDGCLKFQMYMNRSSFDFQAGSVAEWSARRTRNPAVPGSSPALATCWIWPRSSRVQILGPACK